MTGAAGETQGTKPVIRHTGGDLPEIVDQIEDAISKLDGADAVFVWSGGLCRIHKTAEPEAGSIARPAGAYLLRRVSDDHLAEHATKAASHVKFNGRSKDWVAIDCPRRVASALLARGHFPKVRPLHGIVEAPTLTPDGTLVDTPGYHSSGLFVTGVPQGYKRPASALNKVDAQKATNFLMEAVSTFPFVSDADRIAFVAAVITALVRRSLPAAPMVGITAPTPGTGKSLLAELVAEIAQGRSAAMLALGEDEAETEKRLYSALLAGDALLIADNIETQLKGALLCQILTASSVQFRPLGVSAITTVPTHTTLIATGNNLAIIGDLRRRVMLVRLDAATERPEQRTFKRDALAYVAKRRGELISAALTIVRAYLDAGAPNVPGLAAYGGFSDWDRLVRRPLVWAGFPDPLAPAEGLRETDPDLEATRALFAAWRAAFQDTAATVAEAIAKARASTPRYDGDSDPTHPELREAIQAAAGDKLDSRRLGGWLRRHKDRIVDGLQLQQAEADAHAKVARWRVHACG